MVYVAESGASKEETEANLEKLEQEKKMAIELRMRLKRQKHEAQVRAMEKAAENKIKAVEERLGVLEEEHGPAPETIELRKLKEKRQDGLEAINKIKSIKERILQEEQDRKNAKIIKTELEKTRSSKEKELRER